MDPTFLSIAPDALADAGRQSNAGTNPGEIIGWRADDARSALLTSDPDKLIRAWRTTVDRSPGGVRLAVSGVDLGVAWTAVARLRAASGVASAFLVDQKLSPFPLTGIRLRVGVLAGSRSAETANGSPIGPAGETLVLRDPAEACDILIVDGAAELARAGDGGFRAGIVLVLTPDRRPDADELRFIGAAARTLSAGMWAVVDHRPAEVVRALIDAAADDESLDVAIGRYLYLVVAHPGALETTGRMAMTGADGAEAPQKPPRYVGAQVYDDAGVRRRHAFRPGVRHDVSVRIGPYDEDWLQSGEVDERTLISTGDGAALDVFLTVDLTTGMLTTPRKALVLPRLGASREVTFPVDVPADQDVLRLSVNVYQQQRLVQVLVVTGPVHAEDIGPGGATLSVTRSVLRPITADTGWRPPFDASLGFHAGGSADALVVNRGRGARLDTGRLADLQRELTGVLQTAVGADGALGAEAGGEQQTALLRSLARYGQDFYREMVRQGFADLSTAGYLQVVTAENDVAWPVEMVYDRGYPVRNARLCRQWRTALTAGTCGCRRTPGTQARRVVCPLGFWGIRMVIERRILSGATTAPGSATFQTDPLPDRRTLRPIDSVVFAAKHGTVGPADRDRIRGAYRDRLGVRVDEASSWRQWRSLIREQGPPLLVLLSHNAVDDDATTVLEIGRSSQILIGEVGPNYVVRPGPPDDGPGPLVLLLGCNTAISEAPWQEAVARFRDGSAAVVVGTVVETLGSQAVEAACEIAEVLSGGRRSFGELIREARRGLLRKGLTVALSVVAFGDADWDVSARSPR